MIFSLYCSIFNIIKNNFHEYKLWGWKILTILFFNANLKILSEIEENYQQTTSYTKPVLILINVFGFLCVLLLEIKGSGIVIVPTTLRICSHWSITQWEMHRLNWQTNINLNSDYKLLAMGPWVSCLICISLRVLISKIVVIISNSTYCED